MQEKADQLTKALHDSAIHDSPELAELLSQGCSEKGMNIGDFYCSQMAANLRVVQRLAHHLGFNITFKPVEEDHAEADD